MTHFKHALSYLQLHIYITYFNRWTHMMTFQKNIVFSQPFVSYQINHDNCLDLSQISNGQQSTSTICLLSNKFSSSARKFQVSVRCSITILSVTNCKSLTRLPLWKSSAYIVSCFRTLFRGLYAKSLRAMK